MFTEIHSPCFYWKNKTEVLLIAERLSPSFSFTVLLTTLSLHNQILAYASVTKSVNSTADWLRFLPEPKTATVCVCPCSHVSPTARQSLVPSFVGYSLSFCLSLFLSQKKHCSCGNWWTNKWESVSQFYRVFLHFILL